MHPGYWGGAPVQGYPYPPYPPYGHPGFGYGAPPPGGYPPNAHEGQHQGYGHGAAQGAGQGARMSDLVNEVANGGNGFSTLSKMLNLDDPDFWKGALIGAAAVLLLTSDSVQNALFHAGQSNGQGSKEPDA